MDDTNPSAEKEEFARAIEEDIAWLDVNYHPVVRHASDHFHDLLCLAWKMIEAGEAYVDTSSKEAIKHMRGSFERAGAPSADRDREAGWHRDMFARIVSGALPPGAAVLRARLDLASPNMVLRDPVLWRGMAHAHPRLPGWVSFPTYDFAHPFCDLRDGVALSLCSLEFEERKPLYNHVVDRAIAHGFSLGFAPPVELEFSRLDPDVGLTSKRVVKEAVETGAMEGWDDPRLLTLRGLKAKGYAPDMIKRFVRRLGVSRAHSKAPMHWLEEEVREGAGMALKGLIIRDPIAMYLRGDLPASIRLSDGREVAPETHCWVGRDDVRAMAEPGFFRLAPGAMVRLMGWGGFACVERVEMTAEGLPCAVHARFCAEGKSRATVHVLPAEAGVWMEMERMAIWDGTSDPASCVAVEPGFIEAGATEVDKIFHAPRVGWFKRVGPRRWRMLAGMAEKARP